MTTSREILGLGCAIVAFGLWLLLPSGRVPQDAVRRRMFGGLLAAIGFGVMASQAPLVGDWLAKSLLAAIGFVTIAAAVATISCRSPVYCAIWFGMTLAGTAGLFLLAGAEFLAVATIVVYAGAILVTFLFVLMLSQPEGHTSYDRRSWEAAISAFTGAVLVGVLTATISSTVTATAKEIESPIDRRGDTDSSQSDGVKIGRPEGYKLPWEEAQTAARKGPPLTISLLGAELFTRYLVAVEAAGVLLFAALVGAAVIVSQGRIAMKKRNPLAGSGGKSNAY